MAQRPKFAPAILLIVCFALSAGCKLKPKPTTVSVHVLRDLSSVYGSELDRRILDFQGSNPRLKSGKQIVIQSETGDYKDMLQKQSSTTEDVDLIILNSPDDAKVSNALVLALPQAVNVCAGLKACPANIPAIIPSQISGDSREGAQAFQAALQKTP